MTLIEVLIYSILLTLMISGFFHFAISTNIEDAKLFNEILQIQS